MYLQLKTKHWQQLLVFQKLQMNSDKYKMQKINQTTTQRSYQERKTASKGYDIEHRGQFFLITTASMLSLHRTVKNNKLRQLIEFLHFVCIDPNKQWREMMDINKMYHIQWTRHKGWCKWHYENWENKTTTKGCLPEFTSVSGAQNIILSFHHHICQSFPLKTWTKQN